MKFFPDAIYADMAVFEKLNVAMPPTNWTWDQMIQAFKDVTSPDEGIYGFNQEMPPKSRTPNLYLALVPSTEGVA